MNNRKAKTIVTIGNQGRIKLKASIVFVKTQLHSWSQSTFIFITTVHNILYTLVHVTNLSQT